MIQKCENCANYYFPKCMGADIPEECDNFTLINYAIHDDDGSEC